MQDILSILKSRNDLLSTKGCTEEDISKAEEDINCKFSEDYKAYLLEFGSVKVNGHEITGIIKSKRLNVVDVTLSMREKADTISHNLYVVEDLGIDKIVIWEDSRGNLYQSVGGQNFIKMKESLGEYILS